MVLEICFGVMIPLGQDHGGKVKGRARRMVLSIGREGNGIGLWKAIKRGWGTFKAKTRFVVGNRTRIKL